MKELLKKKPVQFAFCGLSLLLGAYSIHGFVGLVHQTHTRYVEHDFIAAMHQLQQSPAGIERVETFIKQLKAIDTDYAPDDVKRGLHDYISSLQQSVEALQAGRDTRPYDKAIADSKERLIAACKKYE